MALRIIDLFAGAGGFTLGFTNTQDEHNQPAFETVWANDFNEYAVATYNANFGNHCIWGDIVPILENPRTIIPEAEVVIGGPPCQGFSLLNKNRTLDPRKQLWLPFMDIVQRSRASVFVMENVPELLTSEEYGQIREVAEGMGFELEAAKLIAANYGVPQVRTRAFIMGSRLADPKDVFPPLRTHRDPRSSKPIDLTLYHPNVQPWLTVRDVISDLAEPVGTEIRGETGANALHFGRNPTSMSMERYRIIAGEGMNRFDLQRLAPHLTPKCWINKKSGGTDLFGRLWWDRPSVTIRTEFFKPEKGRYLHPEQHRPITHREAARFQGFPDDFIFKGSKVEIARQIGNAVAVGMAEQIASAVLSHFNRNTEREDRLVEVEGELV
ncbi:DNA cytosine methyltransferase [Spirosoma areae]